MDSAFPNPNLPMDSDRRTWLVLTAAAGGVASGDLVRWVQSQFGRAG